MRTHVVFNNVDASSTHTFDVPLTTALERNYQPQDTRFLLQVTKTGTDGNPRIIIEESLDNNIWTALEDTETWNPYTDVTDVLGIKDNYFMGKYMRVRLEPNGVTTGTVYAIIGLKTKP